MKFRPVAGLAPSVYGGRMGLADVLRERGSRVTQARQLVWEVLESIEGHATAQQILEAVEQRQRTATPNINQSSVYRALQLFSELGLVRESRTDVMGASTWELRHADGEIHLICDGCGGVEHHATETVATLGDELRDRGFTASVIDVRVIGSCARCLAAASGSADDADG